MAIFRRIPEPIGEDARGSIELPNITSPAPIAPSTITLTKQVLGTGEEFYIEAPTASKTSKIPTSTTNFIDTVIGNTSLGRAVTDITTQLTGIKNEVTSLIKDPRYAVFKVLDLFKDKQAKIHPDMSGTDPAVASREILTNLDYQILDEYREKVKISNSSELRFFPLELRDFTNMPTLGDKYEGNSNLKYLSSDSEDQISYYGGPSEKYNGYQVAFKGYKSVKGLNIGLTNLWDIKIANYFPTVDGKEYPTFVPPVPIVSNVGIMDDNYVPVTTYSFEDYSSMTSSIPLMNGASIEYLSGLKQANTLTLTFLEDNNYTWTRYFNNYATNIYNKLAHSVAPYKQSCLLVTIITYNTQNKIYFGNQLICIPTNLSKRLKGENDPGTIDDITVNFSIVGEIL